MRERRYRLLVDGEEPLECSEAALMSAWSKSIPDLALRVRVLRLKERGVLFKQPHVEIERIA